MNYQFIKIVLFLGYINSGFCDTEIDPGGVDKDYQGDDYDYSGDYDDNKSFEFAVNAQPTNDFTTSSPPYFQQADIEISTKRGDTVLLNCDVRNFQISNVVLWYKENTIIANGQFVTNHRGAVMKNNSLRITNVQDDDLGNYYCEVLPNKIRLHTLLTFGTRLLINCDGNDVTDSSLTFKEGERHYCECKTTGTSNAVIKWFFKGERAENVVTSVTNGRMLIAKVGLEHSGVYQCLGDDHSSEPLHASVSIGIQHRPKVSTHRHHINSDKGKSAELYCDFAANPTGNVRWLRLNEALRNGEKYAIKSMEHKGRTRSILTVTQVNTADLGEYECQVTNSLGSDGVRVYLIFEPENPQFDGMDIMGNKVILHWLVKSLQPLSEAVLDYKMNGSYTWSTVSVIHTHRHAEHDGIWKVTHEIELVPGTWHARLKTRNTIGWSKFSQQHDFQIKDENDDYVRNETPPEDLVLTAGFGGNHTRTNAATHSSNVMQVLLVIAFLLTFL